MEKMTAFTDSEYTYLHELDLTEIKEIQALAIKQDSDMVTHVNVEYCVLAAKRVPALIAEVERLRTVNSEVKTVEWVVREARMIRERLEDENTTLAIEVNQLREALQFYADIENYATSEHERFRSVIYRPIMIDGGLKARNALDGDNE